LQEKIISPFSMLSASQSLPDVTQSCTKKKPL